MMMNNWSSILTSSSSFSLVIVKLGAAAMISSSVCVKGSSFSSQVDDNFFCFYNLFLPSEVFLPSWKHEILSSLEPSTANPRAHDFMELISISFDKLSHACRNHWTIFHQGTGFILRAVLYSWTQLANQSL